MFMKKILSFCLFTLFLSACAGNPPAWWNPNNRYGTVGEETLPVAPAKQAVVVEEEELESVPDTTYEEVTLTPMTDEENENETGASSAQNEDDNLPAPSVLE